MSNKSVYETGKFRFTFGIGGVAAVLLTLVVVTGYYLMMGSSWYKVMFAQAVVLGLALICLKTARGSQRRAMARTASVDPSPAPLPARLVVHESVYADGFRGIRLPLDEAVGLGVINV